MKLLLVKCVWDNESNPTRINTSDVLVLCAICWEIAGIFAGLIPIFFSDSGVASSLRFTPITSAMARLMRFCDVTGDVEAATVGDTDANVDSDTAALGDTHTDVTNTLDDDGSFEITFEVGEVTCDVTVVIGEDVFVTGAAVAAVRSLFTSLP